MNGRGYQSFLVIFIEALEIYTEVEGFIFLEGKDHQSTMGGGSLAHR